MAENTPSMTEIPDNVEKALRDYGQPDRPTALSQFAPKHRGNDVTLENIRQDVRKSINEVLEHVRRLEEYSGRLKERANEVMRSLG